MSNTETGTTTTYTITVACQFIPAGLRPTRTVWRNEDFTIEEESSWIGAGRASMAAIAAAEAKYGERLADTSYTFAITPLPE